jgi:hypothetical protein
MMLSYQSGLVLQITLYLNRRHRKSIAAGSYWTCIKQHKILPKRNEPKDTNKCKDYDGFTFPFELNFYFPSPAVDEPVVESFYYAALAFHASARSTPPNHSVEAGSSVNTGSIRRSEGTP